MYYEHPHRRYLKLIFDPNRKTMRPQVAGCLQRQQHCPYQGMQYPLLEDDPINQLSHTHIYAQVK